MEWFRLASYDQFRFSLASPQASRQLGWIMMDKKATEYRSGGTTVPMHLYIGEACQKAYDKWGIKADDLRPALNHAGPGLIRPRQRPCLSSQQVRRRAHSHQIGSAIQHYRTTDTVT